MMVNKHLSVFFLLVFLIFGPPLMAQEKTSIVENIAGGINSEYEELSPILTPDGLTLYFVRMNHPENKFGKKGSQDIWYSEKSGPDTWTEAKRLPNDVNIGRYNAVHWISPDGNKMMIDGVFDKNGVVWKKRGFSFITKVNNTWSRPEKIKIKGFDNKNDGSVSSVWLSPDESVMILAFSTIYNSNESDIYVSLKKNNKYSRPKKIKDLSSKADEHTPFVANDGETIYFSSNRDGNYDIYVAAREDETWRNWSEPRPMESNVNTGGMEAYYKIFEEGEMAMYTSTTNAAGGSDIFVQYMEEKKPEQILVKGVIRDNATQQVLKTNLYQLLLNGNPVTEATKEQDSAAFEFSMQPSGEMYLTANLTGYRVDTATLNEEALNHENVMLELFASKTSSPSTPTTFTVYGKVQDQETGMPIEGGEPTFKIGTSDLYAVNYNPQTGEYSFSMDIEDVSPVTVTAPGYTSQKKGVTPSGTSERIEVNFSLSKREEGVLVQGDIINQKTGNLLGNVNDVKILVDNQAKGNVNINSAEKSYSMILKPGKVYTISASKPEFFGVSENLDLTNKNIREKTFNILLAPVEAGQKVKLNNIFFESGRSSLKDESIPELDRVVKFMLNNPNVIIELEGHTDSVGGAAFNKRLSEQRAKSVAMYVILKGVPNEQIKFVGMGESDPIASNDTPEGRQQNRRVEFEILSSNP